MKGIAAPFFNRRSALYTRKRIRQDLQRLQRYVALPALDLHFENKH